MSETITTIQWNIGGGKVLQPGGDIHRMSSYSAEGLDCIIDTLRELEPDIATFQEVHADGSHNQVETIARAAGLPYYVSDFYSDSHIEPGQRLGQGIISRYPLTKHVFRMFTNPDYETVWENGITVRSHDKGVTSCAITVDETELVLKTLHLIPFGLFGVDPRSVAAQAVLLDVQDKVRDDAPRLLVQGDFNLDVMNLRSILPLLIDDSMQEITQVDPTFRGRKRLDHVVFRGLRLVRSGVVDTVRTDHFPVVSVFEI